jgi:hypothetical protein
MQRIRRHGPLAALALLAAGAFAIAQAPASPPPQAKESAQDPAARLEALTQRYEAAMKAFYDKVRAEKDEQAQAKLFEQRPGKEFVAEFKGLALEAMGTPTAAKAWMQVIDLASDFDLAAEVKTAIDTLLSDYIQSPDLGDLAFAFQRMGWRDKRDEGIAGLRKLAADSPHKPVQAAALFSLGSMLMDGSDKDKAEGRATFERIMKD